MRRAGYAAARGRNVRQARLLYMTYTDSLEISAGI